MYHAAVMASLTGEIHLRIDLENKIGTHTQIVSLLRLYLDGSMLVDGPWFTYLTHVAVWDVLTINFHAVHMLPHAVTHNSTLLGNLQFAALNENAKEN